MPAEPISERIAEDLLDTLNDIDGTGNFHANVTAVRRKQLGQEIGDNVLVLCQGDLEQNEAANPLPNRITWVQDYWIDYYIVEDDDAGDAIDTRINRAIADVFRAVMADPHRRGLAHDTFPAGAVIMPDETGGGIAGVSILVRVQYRTLLDDPLTQA